MNIKKHKKIISFLLIILSLSFFTTGCITQGEFKRENKINTISREDGSGTRTSFVDLFEITKKDSNNKIIDNIDIKAEITNSTSIMMGKVEGDINAIGYISLGSLNNTVKAVKIDGAEPTKENISNSSYKIARAFNIITKGKPNDVSADFINFIFSTNGHDIVQKAGYVSAVDEDYDFYEYTSKNLSGKLVIGGSSSVAPVMEVLREEYLKLNKNINIDLETSDSTTGVNTVLEGICDIGMTSRSLSESEIEKNIVSLTIAWDGIVLIVNNNNPISELSSQDVKDVYSGKFTHWSDLIKD